MKIPLFPLDAILFPHGYLPLRIFEPRYLDMVSDCMKSDSGIGVILIDEGQETGNAAKTHEIGTLSNISYWHKRSDGMLGITLKGEQRFRILSIEKKSNQLLVAEIELLPSFEVSTTIDKTEKLIRLLKQIIAQLEPPFTTMDKFYDDLDWVSARLIEVLPLSLTDKQDMLCMNNVDERVSFLCPLLVRMEML